MNYDEWERIVQLYGFPTTVKEQHEAPEQGASPFWHAYGPSNDFGHTVFDMTAKVNADIRAVYEEIKAHEGKAGYETYVLHLKDGLYRLYDLKKLMHSAREMFAPAE
jgi:hypothetical protein